MIRPQPFSSGPWPYFFPRIIRSVFRFLRQFPPVTCPSEKEYHLVSLHFAETMFVKTEIASVELKIVLPCLETCFCELPEEDWRTIPCQPTRKSQ